MFFLKKRQNKKGTYMLYPKVWCHVLIKLVNHRTGFTYLSCGFSEKMRLSESKFVRNNCY